MDQIMQILAEVPPDFDVLSGDDSLTVPLMSLGAKGVHIGGLERGPAAG